MTQKTRFQQLESRVQYDKERKVFFLDFKRSDKDYVQWFSEFQVLNEKQGVIRVYLGEGN